MQNPDWLRDEIILALDLYFSPDRGSIDSTSPKVIELSNLLRKLPLVLVRPDEEKFRNPNGVSLKLSNFLAIDPKYGGKGMSRTSKLDREVFFEFNEKRKKLHQIANEIKMIAKDESLSLEISKIGEDEQIEEGHAEEGKLIYKLHRVRERDSKITKRKKELELKRTGKLTCEICGFDFFEFYGEVGRGFIECHHRTPLASLTTTTKTRLEDLALVCSNCHRIIHRTKDLFSLKDILPKPTN